MKTGSSAFKMCICVFRALRPILKYVGVTLLLAVITNSLPAQTNPLSEKRFYARSMESAQRGLIEEQKAIYSGPLYFQYFVDMGNDGHPFYNNLKPESIQYDGIVYSSVNFIYDIFKDEVLVINPDSNWISLDKTKIAHFYLGGHKIEKINDIDGLQHGFYEVFFEKEKISLVAKWTKLFRASVWKEKVDFFLIRDKVYPVRNKKELLGLLSDKETELKAFIRKNKLSFKKEKASDFRRLVEYYTILSE